MQGESKSLNYIHGLCMLVAVLACCMTLCRQIQAFPFKDRGQVTTNTTDINHVLSLFDIAINESAICTIKNSLWDEYIYASDSHTFDNDRRLVFGCRQSNRRHNYDDWDIMRHEGDIFTIKNVHFDEYLYAAGYAPKTPELRRVFTWRRKERIAEDLWEIKPVANSTSVFTLRNVHQDEFLVAGNFPWKLDVMSFGSVIMTGNHGIFDARRRGTYTWQKKHELPEGEQINHAWRISCFPSLGPSAVIITSNFMTNSFVGDRR